MNSKCTGCGIDNPAHARFCQSCGRMLGVTALNGATVVQPHTVSAGASRSGIAPLGAAYGPPAATINRTTVPGRMTGTGVFGQRELTQLIIDVSPSMLDRYDDHRTKLDAAQRAMITMVCNKNMLDSTDEIGVVSFSKFANLLLPLCAIGPNKKQIIETLQTLVTDGGTDIDAGLKVADQALQWHRFSVVRRIILLTDGQGGYPLQTAESLKQRGVVIDAIGVGDQPSDVDEKLLRAVASVVQGERRYRFIKDQQTLVNHCTQLAQKTCIGT